MSKSIKPGTALLNRAGRLRLSRDLNPERSYVTVGVNTSRSTIHLKPSGKRAGAIQVCYPRLGVAVILLRPTLKILGLSRFAAMGEYSGRRVGTEIIVDLKRKTSTSKKPLFSAGGASREVFEQCCQGTTEEKIRLLCQNLGVQFPSVWRDMNDAGGHGCRIERRGDWIRLYPPKTAKRTRRPVSGAPPRPKTSDA